MFVLSLTCLLTGLVLAGITRSYPHHRTALEWAGGALLIVGLSFLGFGLRLFR